MKLRNIIISTFFTMIFSFVEGQEMVGLFPDNYSPSLGMQMNPASIADQKPWISIRLAGFDVYARNNFVYIPDNNLLNYNNFDDPQFNYDRNEYNAYSKVEVLGPAITFSLGKQSIGINSRARAFAFADNIPEILGEVIAEESNIEDGSYEAINTRVKSLVFGEVGATYSRIIQQGGFDIWSAGITVNKLFGFQTSSVIIDNATVVVTDNSGLLTELEGNYAYADPDINAGKGWGVNFGLEYKKMKQNVSSYVPHSAKGGCATPDYKYKIGISLIDFGKISFGKSTNTGVLNENTTTDSLGNMLIGQNDDLSTVVNSNIVKASLPSAFVLQIDYNINDLFYASGLLVQKVSTASVIGAERNNLIGGSIRLEHRWIGLSLPVTLQNYIHPQVGLALRLGPVAVGSDHIIPIFFKSDIYAADIYFNIEIPIMKSPQCKDKRTKGNGKQKKSRHKKTDFVPCPSW